ncbi:MAG: valyl-tRNA synthetase [Parcubacteria group bacterium GW2011_GWF2_44_8b]|nr:MAG: valyl-tRNA synthetase [Parcubacteria group bacterium GW2011_GWC1_43_30]KKT80794.1 MAG: valyl-tRNA synthetase [Parcubacteria group bacterium GW2011_GWF2_44_8b]
MNEKFLTPYNPGETEDRIYKLWEKSGFFNPDNLPERHQKPFSIILPPPNATGTLHVGGSLMTVIQDIIIRYKRMAGFKTLWLPGTDHAAIASNSKVEKILYKEEGKSRHNIGREAFVAKVEKFVNENRGALKHQISKMGASLDWSREAFTFDEKRNLAVRTAFKKMYDAGLIYRGTRIINWDPKGQTTISDDEIVYKEEPSVFYYLKYGPFTIATARPETKFGDKYVVMHPADERYKDYQHGQKIELEWINTPITATIIKDEAIDMTFGTGVMTITPWHDQTDFEIAERHKLEKEQIIDLYGKLKPIAGEFTGMKIAEVREKIIEKLEAKGLLVKKEPYMHNVATAERTGGHIEPQIMNQWFVNVNKTIAERDNKTLKNLMHDAVSSGQIKILPEHFEKTYFHWVNNLHDWNISRQIWYGHRIPAWYKNDEVYVGVDAPTGPDWEQDPDTLDTWFSSGLWTFSALGWPEKTKDLGTYHPTDILETGYDILFFWVARMILMSEFLLGEIPFKTVYLHGLVRNQKGEKLSKSLGDNADPLSITSQYGTDALRMALIVGVGPGSDSKLSNDKLKAYKNFANKIWNIARFVLSQERDGELDKELVDEFDALAKDITDDMENYHFYIAAEKIYAYVWHRFADEIIEEAKKQPGRGETLYYILENSLKLLHPFMPFITEEIWSELKGSLLMIEPWPVK